MSDWQNRTKKREAILRVLRHIIANPQAGQACIGRGNPPFNADVQVHQLFQDPNIGNIQIPADARVVFFTSGEEALEQASSIIIELPPQRVPAGSTFSGQWSDTELMTFVLGNYQYW